MAEDRFRKKMDDADWIRRSFLAAPSIEPVREDGVYPGQGQFRPAAVLVPVVIHPERPAVLLTRRTDHLHNHPGQVSFPGGRVEKTDLSPVMTALRETEEEIGLDPERIELLGDLPTYFTGTGFSITPVVGLVHLPFELKLDTFEVAEAFEVPLAHFLDPANHRRERREYKGRIREYYAMPYDNHFIWGATAGILVSLYRLLGGREKEGGK